MLSFYNSASVHMFVCMLRYSSDMLCISGAKLSGVYLQPHGRVISLIFFNLSPLLPFLRTIKLRTVIHKVTRLFFCCPKLRNTKATRHQTLLYLPVLYRNFELHSKKPNFLNACFVGAAVELVVKVLDSKFEGCEFKTHTGHGSFSKLRQFRLPYFASIYSAANEYKHCLEH